MFFILLMVISFVFAFLIVMIILIKKSNRNLLYIICKVVALFEIIIHCIVKSILF